LPYPVYDGGDRFTAVWRGRRIAQPGGGHIRLVSVHVIEGSSAQAP
jgi:hypothetical protein